ncbi:GNAT family N-acetyltransferase [Labrys neptuniae]
MERQALPLQTAFGAIRSARPADAERILQMVEKLAAHHGDASALTLDNLARDLFGQKPWIYMLIAEAGDKLVGYAALCGLSQLQFGARGLDIHHLFTEANFRGGGVGTSLVEGCKIKARMLSCRYLTVGTHPDNHQAQGFYESLGFARRDSHHPRFSMRLDEPAVAVGLS